VRSHARGSRRQAAPPPRSVRTTIVRRCGYVSWYSPKVAGASCSAGEVEPAVIEMATPTHRRRCTRKWISWRLEGPTHDHMAHLRGASHEIWPVAVLPPPKRKRQGKGRSRGCELEMLWLRADTWRERAGRARLEQDEEIVAAAEIADSRAPVALIEAEVCGEEVDEVDPRRSHRRRIRFRGTWLTGWAVKDEGVAQASARVALLGHLRSGPRPGRTLVASRLLHEPKWLAGFRARRRIPGLRGVAVVGPQNGLRTAGWPAAHRGF